MIRFLLSLYFGTCIFSLCTLIDLIIDVMKDLDTENFDFENYTNDNNNSPIQSVFIVLFLICCPIINIIWSFITLSNYREIRESLLEDIFYTHHK